MGEKTNQIGRLLIEGLCGVVKVDFSDFIKFDSKLLLTIDPINKLDIEIKKDSIRVMYSEADNEFWAACYRNEYDFVYDAIKFITLLLQNTIRIKCVYSAHTLISYKVWAVDKKSEQKRLLQVVTRSLNPFLWFRSKAVKTKEIEFSKQG
ncbi:MAG: hypothetical protein FWC25_01040 [Dehalococcoidia bacterium]|nr:hypothetical protein [Dehalococcoidia bacterium]